MPGCGRVTIGPGPEPNNFASIGVACHIYSAAPGGPRGQGSLTAEQLGDVENGFWACQDHAKLIDTNEGARYPANLLRSWRELHQARIYHELSGLRLPVRWVERIAIERSATVRGHHMFKPDQELALGRVTLLLGENGSGKSAICDWLASSMSEERLQRWDDMELSVSVTVHNPEPHTFAMAQTANKRAFRLDGSLVPFNPLPVVVQFVRRPLRSVLRGASEVEELAQWLGVDSLMIRSIAARIADDENPMVESAFVDAEGRLTARLRIEKEAFTYSQLGNGARVMLAIGFAIARAKHTGVHVPTVLVVDGCFYSFDEQNQAMLVRELARIERFQTIVADAWVHASVEWHGWNVAKILEESGGAIIVQD